MILKSLILSTFILFSLPSFSQPRNKELLNLVNQELNEVLRLNKQLGSQNPSLLLRLAEIYLEKARIVKDEENFTYLSLDPNQRKYVSKKKAFEKSQKYFGLAQKVCYYILKRFKNYKNKAEVYYILAYNAKEYLELRKAEVFFKKAIATAEPKSFTETKSKLALAEMYYNQKEYAKAKVLYEPVLQDKSQRWWTKDAFNLAWCYFRLGQKSKAIELMNEVYGKSKDSKYINVSEYVERDLAYFYSESGDLDRAVAFYQSIGKDIASNLLSVSKHLVAQGRFSSAEKTLLRTKNLSKSPEDVWVEANLELLEMYQKFSSDAKHLSTSIALYKSYQQKPFNPSYKERFLYQVSTQAKKLQKEVVSKEMKQVPQSQMQKAKRAATYFKIQGKIVPELEADSYFLAAESLYGAELVNKAIPLYSKSLSLAKKTKNQRLYELSLQGLIASLVHKKASKDLKEKYFASSYEELLLAEKSKDKRSRVYQSLFHYYLTKKDFSKAEDILNRASDEKVLDVQKSSVMVAALLDAYKNQSNKEKVLEWKKKIDSREVLVSQNLKEKVNEFSLALEFEGVEDLVKSGNTDGAILKYTEILGSNISSSDAKKNSAYNLASLYLRKNDPEKSLEFARKSLNLMNSADLLDLSDEYFSLAGAYFDHQLLGESAIFNDLLVRKYCSLDVKQTDSFFRNTVILYLANSELVKALSFYREYSEKCKIENQTKKMAMLEIAKLAFQQKNASILKQSIFWLKKLKSSSDQTIIALSYARDLSRSKRTSYQFKKEIDTTYKRSVSQKETLSLEALNIVASIYLESLENDVDAVLAQKYVFPEQAYNKILQVQFSRLEKITAHITKILQIGAGRPIARSYRLLVDSYQAIITQVRTFTPPKKSESYIQSFRKSMEKVAISLSKRKDEFEKEAKTHLKQHLILSDENKRFLSGNISGLALEQGDEELVFADRSVIP